MTLWLTLLAVLLPAPAFAALPTCQPNSNATGIDAIKELFKCGSGIGEYLIYLALYIGGGLIVIVLIWAGILYVQGGDNVKKAKAAVTAAIVGIFIIAFSYAMINMLNNAFIQP